MGKIFRLFLVAMNLGVLVNCQGTIPIEGQTSGGVGCHGIAASFLNKPITNTSLFTGTFYQILAIPSTRNNGFVTWAERTDSDGKNLVFTEYNNAYGFYSRNGRWFLDTYWAFLTTNTLGWYRMINCGVPYKYLAVSRDDSIHSNSASGPGAALIINEIYPGRHSKDDFLFKPVYLPGRGGYQIYTKAFGTSMVLDSETQYHGNGDSFFLRVDQNSQFYFPDENTCQKSVFLIAQELQVNPETPVDNGRIFPAGCDPTLS